MLKKTIILSLLFILTTVLAPLANASTDQSIPQNQSKAMDDINMGSANANNGTDDTTASPDDNNNTDNSDTLSSDATE